MSTETKIFIAVMTVVIICFNISMWTGGNKTKLSLRERVAQLEVKTEILIQEFQKKNV